MFRFSPIPVHVFLILGNSAPRWPSKDTCFLYQHSFIFQVVAHMMPDLPNVGVERDLESFKEFFESPLFRADGLKIYPTLVIRGTGLYELWKTGRYNFVSDSNFVRR